MPFCQFVVPKICPLVRLCVLLDGHCIETTASAAYGPANLRHAGTLILSMPALVRVASPNAATSFVHRTVGHHLPLANHSGPSHRPPQTRVPTRFASRYTPAMCQTTTPRSPPTRIFCVPPEVTGRRHNHRGRLGCLNSPGSNILSKSPASGVLAHCGAL